MISFDVHQRLLHETMFYLHLLWLVKLWLNTHFDQSAGSSYWVNASYSTGVWNFLFSAHFLFSKIPCAKISAFSFIFNSYFVFLLQFHFVFPHFCQISFFVNCSLRVNTDVSWKYGILFMKISQVISRTTGSNIDLFVLILMHLSYQIQIWP